MSDFFRTAFYKKNITNPERVLRIALAMAGVVAAFAYLQEPWMQWSGAASAVGFAFTGVFGFCPACYLAGRKLSNRTAS
jgi:hypothetical protein